MPNPDDLRVLRKEVEADLAVVERLARDLARARAGLPSEPTQENLAYLAYLLHDSYTGWESAFRRIATAFENRLDPARWHAHLLQRMSLEIPRIRPAVIDTQLRERLEELRSFRHFFRHSYGATLRLARIELVLEAYDAAASEVGNCLSRFLNDVESIADSAEET